MSRLPLQGEIIRESKTNLSFPSEKTYRRFAGKGRLLKALAVYCRASAGFEEVLALCESRRERPAPADETTILKPEIGYVYLVRHGARREFKVGRTNNPIRREGEIGVELPQKLEPISRYQHGRSRRR